MDQLLKSSFPSCGFPSLCHGAASYHPRLPHSPVCLTCTQPAVVLRKDVYPKAPVLEYLVPSWQCCWVGFGTLRKWSFLLEEVLYLGLTLGFWSPGTLPVPCCASGQMPHVPASVRLPPPWIILSWNCEPE